MSCALSFTSLSCRFLRKYISNDNDVSSRFATVFIWCCVIGDIFCNVNISFHTEEFMMIPRRAFTLSALAAVGGGATFTSCSLEVEGCYDVAHSVDSQQAILEILYRRQCDFFIC